MLLTCNYDLTVERVKRSLRGLDGYLLVANSRGVNVWCAAAGGLFTHHDVISALKTSGIERLVDHREVILPQLAAAGIEAGQVQQKSGWNVVWGPVDARDVPAFVANRGQKTAEMRQVRFPLRDRVEMAAAWAFPISVFAALALLFVWPAAILPLVLLVWGISALLYTAFPSYERWLHVKRREPRDAGLEFGRGGIQLALWGPCLLALIALAVWSDPFGWADALRWGAATLAIVLVVTIDLSGSTPVLKSGLYPDRLLEVSLDRESCIACGACERVCPRNCFQIDPLVHAAAMPGSARCVQCGACIVQCPADALRFHGPGGEVVPPEVVRKYKLNLMGSRKHDPFRK